MEKDRPDSRSTRPRALVTGAAGFIGSALTRALVAANWEVVGLDDFSSGWPERLVEQPRATFLERDVNAPGVVGRLLEREGAFDACVHLAARVGVREVLRDPEGCRAENLRGVRELIAGVAGLPAHRRPRLFCASSSEVYADSTAPLAEGEPTRDVGARGRWAYAASKLRGEELLDEAAPLWPATRGPVHLRFFNVVGPGQDSNSGMVLPIFVERALAGEPLPVHGDGRQIRTFAHVDQVARALVGLLERRVVPPGALNVGGVARCTIRRLALAVKELSGSSSPLELTDPRLSCGPRFEEVFFREPRLERLAGLGLAVPDLAVEEIVADTLARHAALARLPRRGEGLARREVPRRSSCASLVS